MSLSRRPAVTGLGRALSRWHPSDSPEWPKTADSPVALFEAERALGSVSGGSYTVSWYLLQQFCAHGAVGGDAAYTRIDDELSIPMGAFKRTSRITPRSAATGSTSSSGAGFPPSPMPSYSTPFGS
jgi:hypothetical protein